METSPANHLIQDLCDPESPQYSSHISWWIGQLREWKHESRSAEAGKFNYAIYHGCRGVFEASKHLIGSNAAHNIKVGEVVIQELTNALPLTTEGSAARQNIELLIQSIRSGVEQFQSEK